MNAAAKLRQRLLQVEIIVIPGGGSPLELKLIEQAGFEAGYISGYATAAARYAEPDIGHMGRQERDEKSLHHGV